MAAGTVTITTAACHIPELWSAETIDAVEAKVVLCGLVDRKWEKELKVGDTLNIPYISNLTPSSKSANTNITLETITEPSEIITVSTYEYVAFGVENIVQVQSKTNQRQKYTQKAGYGLASSMEELVSAGSASFTNTVGTLGVESTDDDIIRGWQYLEDFDAPSEDRFIYIRPAAYAGLMKLDKYMHADYVGGGGRGVREAFVGKLYGMDVHTSNLAYAPSSGQCQGWLAQKGGYAVVQQEIKTRSDYVIIQDADVVLATNLFGYTEITVPPRTEGGATAVDYLLVALNTIG